MVVLSTQAQGVYKMRTELEGFIKTMPSQDSKVSLGLHATHLASIAAVSLNQLELGNTIHKIGQAMIGTFTQKNFTRGVAGAIKFIVQDHMLEDVQPNVEPYLLISRLLMDLELGRVVTEATIQDKDIVAAIDEVTEVVRSAIPAQILERIEKTTEQGCKDARLAREEMLGM